jgi:hypothetical protein
MSVADLWLIPTPPASAVDVDLAPGVAVTVTPALAGVAVSASPGTATATTDGSGEAWLATGNGDYTISGVIAGYTISPVTVEVRDDAPTAALSAVAIPDIRPLTVAADILAVRLPAVLAGDPPTEVWPEVWWSDLGITTDVDDTPSAVAIEERLVGEVRYRARVVPLVWGRGEGASPVGQITLANGDGALDAIVGAGWTGRIAEIYRGDRDVPVSEWTLLVRTRLAGPPSAEDEETVTLTLGSIADRLDQPLQTQIFPDDTPAEALRGQQRPFGFGYCYSVPAVLVDPADLVYEVHDGTEITVERVRAAGNILTPATEWSVSDRGFTLLTNPFGQRVVADVLFGSDADAELVILALLARAGIAPEDVADATLPVSTPVGVWSGTPTTGAELLSYVLDSFAAGWYVDRFDRIAVWQLSADLPSVAGRKITIDDLTDRQIAVTSDTAPGYVDVVAGGRNWHVHSPGELAGALLDPTITQAAIDLQADYRYRRRGDESPPALPSDPGDGYVTRPGGASPRKPRAEATGNGIGTALVEAADVTAEAARLRDIFSAGRRHRFATVEITADLLDLWIGQWAELDLPRFDLVAEGVVVGIDADLASGAVLLTLWLPGPVPPSLPAP